MYSPSLGRFVSPDPIGFAGGNSNLYGFVNNNPVNFTDPSGLAPVGHHWVPVSVLDDADIRGRLSDEAYELGQGSYSGATRDANGKGHRYGTYGGVTHARYNDIVKSEITSYMRVNNVEKMSKDQMDAFIDNIQNGRDHAGDPNKELKAFNDEIRSQSQAHIDYHKKQGNRAGLQKVQTPEQRIKQGQSYIRRGDYIKYSTAAIVASVIGAYVNEAQGALTVASTSKNFKEAVGALAEGDITRANRYMVGSGNSERSYSFTADLVDANYGHAALEFEQRWAQALANATARATAATAPHDRLPPPPLPDNRGALRRTWDWITNW